METWERESFMAEPISQQLPATPVMEKQQLQTVSRTDIFNFDRRCFFVVERSETRSGES